MKSLLKHAFFFLCFFHYFIGFAQWNSPQRYKAIVFPSNVIEYATFQYSIHNVNNQGNLKVYFPNRNIDPVNNKPLIVIVHGGAFHQGDLADWHDKAMILAQMGYAVASINYRLLNVPANAALMNQYKIDSFGIANNESSLPWYAAVQDLNAAVKFMCYNKNALGFDNNKVFLLGESAGAVTVLTFALAKEAEINSLFSFAANPLVGPLNYNTLQACRNQTFTIKGVASLCGVLPYQSFLSSNDQIPLFLQHNTLDTAVPIGGVSPKLKSCLGTRGIIDTLRKWNNDDIPYPCSYLYNTYNNVYAEANDTILHVLNGVSKIMFCQGYIAPFFHKILTNTNSCGSDYELPNCHVFTSIHPDNNVRESADQFTGLNNTSVEQIAAYPNPADDQFVLKGLSTEESTTVTIVNSHGDTVRYFELGQVQGVSEEITLTGLKAGIYLLLVNSGQNSQTLKLVKN